MTLLAVGYEIQDKKTGVLWEVVEVLGEGYRVEERVYCRYCYTHGFLRSETHDVDLRPDGHSWTSGEAIHYGHICQGCFDYLRDGNAVRYHRKGTPNMLGEKE